MVAPSTRTGHSTGPDSTGEQEDKKYFQSVSAVIQAWLCGFVSEMADMRCILYSLAVGVSIR